jgi:hypothetical protein
MPVSRLGILLALFDGGLFEPRDNSLTTADVDSRQPTARALSTAFAPSISFTGGDTFVVGQAGQLNAVERPSATTSLDVTMTATWESSNPGVATVSTTGLVTAIAVGVTVVKASDAAASGTLVVSVVASIVKSLLIVGPSTIPTGQASQLTASVSTTGSRQVVTGGVVWQSSNPAIAAVSDAGILTAVSAGTATITASYQGVVGTLTVTVSDVTVRSIAFYGTTIVTRGLTTQLTATATFADGSSGIVTNIAVWQSLNTDLATVSSNGLVTTLSTAGTATITATYLGVTGSVDITIN